MSATIGGMHTQLLDAVLRHAEAHADHNGIARTPVDGLITVHATTRTELSHQIARPLACLILQGSKQVTMGSRSFTFNAGDSLLVMADVPTVSQVTQAGAAAPYCALALDLSPQVIAELVTEMAVVEANDDAPVRLEPTDAQLADVALRLMRMLERPASLPVLRDALVREFHYWLLAGRHGAAIRRLGLPDSQVRRIARAVALLRAHYAQRIPVEQLAALAGMSPSSFHQHFRAVTSLSPLQFQKQLRLIEARRLMLADGASASVAAHVVGYESVQQFTCEYGRMFGLPPRRDVTARSQPQAVA